RNQEPREAGDRISIFAGSVRDRDAEVRRHFGRGCGCSGHAIERRLDKSAGGITNDSVRDFVLDGIDQFDVSDRTGELANQSSDALVPFASHTNGPFDGSVASYLAFPLGADLRKVIGPDE